MFVVVCLVLAEHRDLLGFTDAPPWIPTLVALLFGQAVLVPASHDNRGTLSYEHALFSSTAAVITTGRCPRHHDLQALLAPSRPLERLLTSTLFAILHECCTRFSDAAGMKVPTAAPLIFSSLDALWYPSVKRWTCVAAHRVEKKRRGFFLSVLENFRTHLFVHLFVRTPNNLRFVSCLQDGELQERQGRHANSTTDLRRLQLLALARVLHGRVGTHSSPHAD